MAYSTTDDRDILTMVCFSRLNLENLSDQIKLGNTSVSFLFDKFVRNLCNKLEMLNSLHENLQLENFVVIISSPYFDQT